jgi:hypothetical protein
LEKRAEQVLPRSERVGGGKGQRTGGRNGLSNICMYEKVNKKRNVNIVDVFSVIHQNLVILKSYFSGIIYSNLGNFHIQICI